MNQGWVIEYAPAINNPIWYICVLMWLYLIYYAAEKIIRRFGSGKAEYVRIVVYGTLILVGAAGWHFRFSIPFLYLSDCRGYAGFILGVFLCYLSRRMEQDKNSRKSMIIVSAIVLFLGAAVILIARNFNWYVWTFAICPSIVILLILLPQIDFPLQEKANFSGISFQIYLWHVPVFYVFQFLIDVFNRDFKHSVLSMVTGLIVVILISVLTEKIMKVVRRLIY